jgi:hypothetical protein
MRKGSTKRTMDELLFEIGMKNGGHKIVPSYIHYERKKATG